MASPPDHISIACLCAAWCRLCEGYRPSFDAVVQRLRQRWPELQADWVDIEDEAELVGDLDIETFPTVLVVRHGQLLFGGTVTPQPETLYRVAAAALEQTAPAAPSVFSPLAAALQQRVAARMSS